jgi:hypothetical protein
MNRITLGLALTLVPALLAAQAPDSTRAGSQGNTRISAQAEVHAQAGVSAGQQHRPDAKLPPGLSAETRARIDAMIEVAKQKDLPTQPMADRVAEGKAKGATEARMVSECRKVMVELETSQEALIQAGREHPSDEEVTRGAQVIARGATRAQLAAFVAHAPSDRSLEVALEVLTQLVARGVPVDRAFAVIGARLTGGASDGQLVSALGKGEAGLGLAIAREKPDLGTTAGASATGALGVGLPRKP